MVAGSYGKSMFREPEPVVAAGPAPPVLDLSARMPVVILAGAFLVQGGESYRLRQLGSLRTKTAAPSVTKASGDLQQMQWVLTSSLLSGESCWDPLKAGCSVHSQVLVGESRRGSVVTARAVQAHREKAIVVS